METKQVNIAIPLKLHSKIREYVEEYGYRNTQDLFLDLVRQKVIFDNVDNKPLRKEFIQDMLSIEENDFIGIEKSEKFHQELKNKIR